MAYEQKDNDGALFANRDRDPNNPDHERLPNAKGTARIGGVDYWVSAWTNTAKGDGAKYQKLAFTPKDQQQGGNSQQRSSAPVNDPHEPVKEDDIPF